MLTSICITATPQPRRLYPFWPGGPLRTGQGVHKGHHGLDIVRGPAATGAKVRLAVAYVERQLPCQGLPLAGGEALVVPHDLLKRRQGTIVHVWSMQGDITQRGRFEGPQVAPG